MYKKIIVTATATSLKDHLGDGVSHHLDEGLAMQAPGTNAGVVYFGDEGSQPVELPAGSSTDVFPVHDTGDIFVKGTASDELILMLF